MTKRYQKSEDYNWVFDTVSGTFIRFGKTLTDDPQYSPFGPEILDLEVSTICSGIKGTPCKFCYKSNTSVGTNMSFDTFVEVLNKLNEKNNLVQIAFGIGDIDANPDLIKMMEYAREHSIIPNITINGSRLTDDWIKTLVTLCGAVSVSHYDDDVCFNAVNALTEAGHKQVNIHKLMSFETLHDGSCFKIVNQMISDDRLKNLHAMVFMTLKQVGSRNVMTSPKYDDEYKKVLDFALEKNLPIGFDSCGSSMFCRYLKENHSDKYDNMSMFIEPCESSLFSSYVNVDGLYYPCSFIEQTSMFKGLDVVNCNSFINDIWFNPTTIEIRNTLIKCRSCPIFNLCGVDLEMIDNVYSK